MTSISVYARRSIHIFVHFFPCLLCVICQSPLSPSPSVSPPLEPDVLNFLDQRLAVVYPVIQAFKNIITSDPLGITQTWIGSDICNYTGFYCDNPPDNLSAIAVASIDFNGFGLSARTLEGFIDQLPDLALFHANSNFFSGTISPKIAMLPNFYELDISNNNFSGDFPMAVLSFSGLTFLDVRFNFFTGSVPPQLFIETLDVLFLNNNNFMQTLPESLGSTPALYLTLANNKFVGPIPRTIFNTSSTLTEILLLNNLLSGCLPYEIGYLRELELFDASNNLLTGPLPCSLGCLAKLEELNLADNLFYGQVPEELCALGNLANLSLSGNYFTRIGPHCWKLVHSGVLDVRKNCLPYLPYQRSLHECAAFFFHPHFCSHPASFKFMPCKVPSPSKPYMTPKRKFVTHDALVRHRLL